MYLRVPSGTQIINLYISNVGSSGWSIVNSKTVTLTTAWQRFQVTGVAQNGLGVLYLQIGGACTVTNGQVFDVWGAQMEVGSTAGPYVPTEDIPVTVGPSVTNILPDSQQWSATTWVVQNGQVAANSVSAPDGSATGFQTTANSGSGDTYVVDYVQNPAQYSSATVTASVYLRVPSGSKTINLYVANVGSTGWSIVNSTTVTLTTAWQRFQLTGVAQNGLTALYLQIGGGGTVTGGQVFDAWGAQMVMGSSEGIYIPTTGTTTNSSGSTVALAANGLNESYSYDAFGNLQQSGNFSFQQAYTTANQLVGWTYDAAGNLLNDAFYNRYTYDAEGKISAVAGYSYVYDAEGNRVEKAGSALVDYIYFGGKPIARLAGGQWTDLVYGAGGLLAEVPGTQSGVPVYRMVDHLGTGVGMLSSTGIPLSSSDYAPFGQMFSGGSTDPYLFTGKERDSESGNDYFGARYYASSMGRWMSPDPSGLVYADPKNPQSLNLYAYVLNNPLIHIDPRGLDCVYFNNAGDGVESVDHHSDSGECGSNGGDWVNGTTYSDLASYNRKSDTWNIASWGNEGGTPTVYWTTAYAPGPGGGGTDQNGSSIPCSGNCDTANGYSYTGFGFFGPQIANGNWYDALHWAVGQTNQVNKFQKWIINDPNGRNWCGAGGTGATSGGDDWSCMAPDYGYYTTGNTWPGFNLVPFSGNKQLQDINQTLCNNVSSSNIKNFFTYGSFAGCN